MLTLDEKNSYELLLANTIKLLYSSQSPLFCLLQGGREYGDEYFAELDFIETCESVKEGYEEEVVLSSDEERDK